MANVQTPRQSVADLIDIINFSFDKLVKKGAQETARRTLQKCLKTLPYISGDERLSFKAWQAGQDDFVKGIAYENGPTDQAHNLIDWQTGWRLKAQRTASLLNDLETMIEQSPQIADLLEQISSELTKAAHHKSIDDNRSKIFTLAAKVGVLQQQFTKLSVSKEGLSSVAGFIKQSTAEISTQAGA